jgi:hypothetical protein
VSHWNASRDGVAVNVFKVEYRGVTVAEFAADVGSDSGYEAILSRIHAKRVAQANESPEEQQQRSAAICEFALELAWIKSATQSQCSFLVETLWNQAWKIAFEDGRRQMQAEFRRMLGCRC